MDRGVWWTTGHRIAKELEMTKALKNNSSKLGRNRTWRKEC